jgi:hypothetical protein
MRHVGLALCCALGCGAAADAATSVRAEFSLAFTCPPERMTVTPIFIPVPPEVARDPARFALWRRNAASNQLFDVSGCNQKTRVVCFTATACQVTTMDDEPAHK